MKRLAAALLLVSLFMVGCENTTAPRPKSPTTGGTAATGGTGAAAPRRLPRRSNPDDYSSLPLLDYKKWSRMRRLVASSRRTSGIK